MKNLLLLFAVLLVFQSCKEEKRTDYVINGTAEGIYNGLRVYLKNIDESGKQIIKDSAIVMNENFEFKGSVEAPEVHFIEITSLPGNIIFMLENNEIDIKVNKQNITESEIKGSESNKDFDTFQEGMLNIREEGDAVMLEYRSVKMPRDKAKKDSLTKILEELGVKLKNYPLTFIKENSSSYFSLSLIELELNESNIDIKALKNSFDNLDKTLRESKKGKGIKLKIDKLFAEYEKIAHLEIGKVAPNFTAPNPDGKNVSLSDIKGKVTIIDFWAAWCGPCRRENPNVVKVYEKYHDKGLEIIGVSLDGNSRQQDPKKAWLDAIEKDKLKWHHVSNLNYFNDPVAKLYNIQSIPATFILDEDGKIVAKNLRGKALENKIQELLEKS